MKTTVFGLAGGEHQPAAYQTRGGTLSGAHAYARLELNLPPGGVPVDLDHDGAPIGEVVYGEVDTDGRLRLVAILDDDAITRVPGAIYFSTTTLNRGAVGTRTRYYADSAELLSIALTLDPASVAAQPVTVMAGDLRSTSDRSRWEISWRSQRPLLGRALDHLGTTPRHRTATRLLDRRDQPELHEHGWGLDAERRPPGRLWHSAPVARIIRVS